MSRNACITEGPGGRFIELVNDECKTTEELGPLNEEEMRSIHDALYALAESGSL